MRINSSLVNRLIPARIQLEQRFSKLLQTIPQDCFEFSSLKEISVGQIFTILKGTYSKEDLNKINVWQGALTTFDLDGLKVSIAKQMQEQLENLNIIAKNAPEKALFGAGAVPLKVKNKISENMLKLLAIKEVQSIANPNLSIKPLSYWYDTNLGIQNPTFSPSRFTHPRDKAIQLTGELVSEDLNEIKKLENEYHILSNDEVQRKKLKIAQKLHKFLSKPESDFIGTFSDKELLKLKQLVLNYDALNNLQNKNGIFTKNIEQTLFSTPIPDDLKKGEYINGMGLVVNKLQLNQTPTIITFSNIDGFNSFKMYDLEKLRKALTIKEEKEALVSEVQFKYTKNHYYIRALQNHNPKQYPNAGKIIGLQLMKLLAEKDCKPVNIEALAYGGSKHSPVNYYMFYGFTPVNYTKEEIEEITNKNGGNFPHETPVKMELTDFSPLRERIERMEKIFFQ